MSASTAIGLVSESLQNLLLGKMNLGDPPPGVTVLAPDEGGTGGRINLFLYKVQENPNLKNLDWQVHPTLPGKLVPPPLSLNLFYLLTAYASNDAQTGNSVAHQMLGEAMRVFYEHPVVPKEYLAAGLEKPRESIQIMQNSLDMEELSKVWSTFTQPFRLSVLYEVSVVQLDMSSNKTKTLPTRIMEIGVPEMGQPYQPPVVASMEPQFGPPGTAITLRGTNLKNCKASVNLGDTRIVDAMALEQDEFQATVPVGQMAGLYEMRVDISNLFRRTFFFLVKE